MSDSRPRATRSSPGLAECQRKLGSGYLSAFPEEFIDRVESQKRVWAPWYTLHKILAGLLDMNEHCGKHRRPSTWPASSPTGSRPGPTA